jgi:hypothetical protein
MPDNCLLQTSDTWTKETLQTASHLSKLRTESNKGSEVISWPGFFWSTQKDIVNRQRMAFSVSAVLGLWVSVITGWTYKPKGSWCYELHAPQTREMLLWAMTVSCSEPWLSVAWGLATSNPLSQQQLEWCQQPITARCSYVLPAKSWPFLWRNILPSLDLTEEDFRRAVSRTTTNKNRQGCLN